MFKTPCSLTQGPSPRSSSRCSAGFNSPHLNSDVGSPPHWGARKIRGPLQVDKRPEGCHGGMLPVATCSSSLSLTVTSLTAFPDSAQVSLYCVPAVPRNEPNHSVENVSCLHDFSSREWITGARDCVWDISVSPSIACQQMLPKEWVNETMNE